MADVNANIDVNINTSGALAQLKALQREIARFHTSVAKSSEAAALAQRDLQRNFINGVNAIQGFSAELRTVKTTAENFTDSLERNKFSMREYFRYSAASTKTFGRFFRSEFDTINKVAEENVKRLQTQYIKMGRDAQGAMRAIAVMPTQLNYKDYSTQVQLAAQRQALFNQLVKQGSTNLLNFGKNTQWAGRQLMVGFTLPLIGLGTAATKTFMDMETAAIKFRKVYGDLFTPTEEREKALEDIENLGRAFTKYGIAVSQTVNLAAEAAAAGFQGLDLQRQVTEATRLQVLGQIDQQKALETTISLQNAFKLSNDDLSDSINFLNAVENQTVVSLDDITTAIPKVAPVIMQLGGNVKDLAFFLTAMKQGGVNASEGANALKSGLASLINPTDKAAAMLADLGVNINQIVEKNQGNLKATVIEFAQALDTLDPLTRARAIEQLFGKFQFARLSTLFENVTSEGTQASRVLDLAGYSVEELASTAESELGITANSAMNKFRKSVEDLRVTLVPVGQLFLEIVTPFLENIGNILEKFNNLSAGTKKVIGTLVIGLGAVAPIVLMTVGLFANFVANGIKGLLLLRNGYLRLTGQSQVLSEQTNFLSVQQQQALAAAASLEQSHMRLQQVFTGEATALRALISEYQRMIAAQNLAATRMPGMMAPGFKPKGYVDGVVMVPGPKGAGDIVPAMLSPGEAVIPAEQTSKYFGLIQGIVADRIPGYAKSNIKSVAERTANVPMYGDLAVRFQSSVENQSQLASVPSIAEVLGPLTARIGEARGLGFGQAAKSQYPSIIEQFTPLVEEFLNRVREEFTATETIISDSSERLARAYQTAGASMEQELLTITSDVERGVVRKAFGVDPDSYGTVAANFRASHGFGGRTGRYPEGNIPTSYTDPAFKKAAGAAYEQISGESPTGMDIGHVFDLKTRKKLDLPTTIPLEQLKTDAQTSQATLNALVSSIEKAEIDIANKIQASSKTARAAGKNIGENTIQGIAEGTASTSPSKKAIQQGQNVVDGFEQGILEGMDDAALAAEKVNNAAMQELGQPLGPGLPMGDVYDQFRSPNVPGGSVDNLAESMEDLDSVTIQAAETTKQSSQKLSNWNSRLMGASFAISGITGAASAFGYNLGGVSDKLFKLSSAMFALQAVVQTLTQAKLLEIAATRIAAAKQAAAFATYGTGLAARGGLVGMLGRIGVFATRLLGLTNPIGWVVTGLTLVAGGIYAYNKSQEAARKRVEGLGDAALIAGKKLEALEKFFGTDFRRFTFESFKYDESTAGPALVAGRRQQAEALMADEEFRKEYKDTVDALRSATNAEAQLVLEGITMQLQARGATTEQIQAVTDSLISMAGKTEITLDFAKIDIKSKEGQAELKKNVDQILKGYNKAFAKGINDSYKRTLNLAGKSIAGAFGALQLQLEDGSISAKEYADQVSNINTQILNMPDSQAKLNLVNAVFDSMGEEAAKAAAGVTNLNNKLLLAQAILLKVADPQAIKNLSSPLFFVQDIGARTLTSDINRYFSQLQAGLKDLDSGTKNGNGSTGKSITLQEKLIKIYQKQAKALEDKLKLMQDVNDEIERNNEFTKQQVDLDRQITEAKMSGNYLEAAALLQQKTMEAAQFARETEEIDIQKQIDSINKRISQLEDKAKITSAERRLLRLEDKKPTPKKEGNNPPPKKEGNNPPPKKEGNNPPPATANDLGTGAGNGKQGSQGAQGPQVGSRPIPAPPAPSATPGTKDWYFNINTGNWEYITRSSKTPAGYVSRTEWMKGKKKYADGGLIKGPGTGTSDSILGWVDGYAQGGPIRVSNGEFILSKKAVDNAGGPKAVGALHQRLRNAPAFKEGGMPGRRSYITNWNQEKIPVMPKGIAKPGTEYAIAPEKNYPIDNIKSPMGSLQRFIDVARSQIGSGHNYKVVDKEGTEWDVDANKYTTYVNDIYKLGSDVLYWCGAFIAWVAKNSGVNISNKMFSAFQASQDYKKKGMFNDLSQLENIKNLKIGDIAWFDFVKANTPGIPDHSAIVTGKSKDSVRAIGQYGMGTVAERSWKINELFGSARPEGFAKGGLIKGFKDGGAPHEMGMKGTPKKQNWFQRYVSRLTESQDQAQSILGKNKLTSWMSADPLGIHEILRKFAGQGRKGDSPALAAALLPLNFMGFGLGRGVASGVKGGVSVAGKVLAGSKKAIDSIYKTQKVEHEGIKYLTYQLAEGGPRFAFQGMGEDLSGLLAAGKIDEIIPTTPQGLLESALKMNPKNKKAQALLESIKNKTYRGNNAETAEYNDFLDSMLGAVSINAKGNAGRIEDSSGFALVMAALNGNEQAAQIVAAKKDAFRKIIADRIAQQKKKIMEGKDAQIAAGKYATGKGDPSKISIFHSRSPDRPFQIDKDGNVSIYTYGEMNADNPLGSQARSTLHFTAINPVKGITERAEDASNIKLVTRLDKAIDQVGNPQNLYDQDTWWSLSPGEPFKIKKGDYTIIKPFKTFEDYLKEVTKRGLIKDKSKSVWDIPDVLFDPKTYEVLHSPGKDEYEGMNIASKANKIAQEALGLKTSLSSHGPDIPSEQSLLDELERIAYDLQIEQGLHSLTGSDRLEQLFYMETGLHHSKVGYADPFAKFTYASNKAASGWSDTLEAVREQARRGNFHTNQIDTRKTRNKYLAFANGGYINMASLPKFKNGIDRVPYDMPAFLHKDERVLTAEENKRYGTSNITLSPTFNITGGNSDEIVNKVMVKLTNLANKNNKGNKVVF